MAETPRRQRREVTDRSLNVLRVLGWRYSHYREAWVHRLGRGSRGPVFREPSPWIVREFTDGEHDVLQTLMDGRGIRVVAEEHRIDLPKRDPSPRRTARPVKVRFQAEDEHRLVYVDGRPPKVNRSGRLRQPQRRSVVVPIKPSRTTG